MANGKYKEWLKKDNLKRLEHMARNGARDVDIAKKIGISKVTLYEWKKRFPEFAEALKKGKDEYDDEVEEALYNLTKGYYVEEETVKIEEDEEGNRTIVRKKTKRYITPSVTAMIYWLQNRRGDRWKTKATEYQNNQMQLNKERLQLDKEKQEDKW